MYECDVMVSVTRPDLEVFDPTMILWLSVSVSCIGYSKRRKFRPKMRQNAFGGRDLPGPTGGA